MKCLLYNFQNQNDEELKKQYICFYQNNRITSRNFFNWTFKINIQEGVRNVKQFFRAAGKKITFLNHYDWFGDSNNFLLNISSRGLITCYSINYFLHKNYYNFFDPKIKNK